MLFEFDTVGLLAVLLVALRLGVLFYFTPIDAFGRVPRRVVVFFTFAFSATLVYALNLSIPTTTLSPANIALYAVYELCNGLAMVLGIYLAFTSFLIAGQLIDAQTGFAAAAILNPTTNMQEPMTGVLLQLLALTLFFLLGMHRLFFEGIARSFALVPLGTVMEGEGLLAALPRFGYMFAYGMMLAAPVLIGLLMLDVGIAMMSRTMPQMNIYFVTLPLRIVVGLIMLVLSLRYMLPLCEEIFREIYRYWSSIMVR